MKPAGDPAELTNLDETAVRALLGTPQSERSQSTAKILVYAVATCRFEIVLFQDMTDLQWRAASWEGIPQGVKGLSGTACYDAVKGGRP